MDIEQQLLNEHSKQNTLRVAAWIGKDPGRFRQLMHLFLRGDYLIAQRAAWVLGHCADAHPDLVKPYIGKMIDRMLEPGVHVAVKRNVVRILQFVPIPKRLLGKVATVCFEFLGSQQEPVAVRCFAMTVLVNIAEREPDLRNEIQLMIEQQMPWGTAGFKSRGKKMLLQLKKIG